MRPIDTVAAGRWWATTSVPLLASTFPPSLEKEKRDYGGEKNAKLEKESRKEMEMGNSLDKVRPHLAWRLQHQFLGQPGVRCVSNLGFHEGRLYQPNTQPGPMVGEVCLDGE